MSEEKDTYPTSSKLYTFGTKNLGNLQGTITFRKIEGIVNMRIKVYRDINAPYVINDIILNLADICDDIGFYPNTVLFMQPENDTYGVPALVRNKSIYIPVINVNQISSDTVGEIQGYSNWIRPH